VAARPHATVAGSSYRSTGWAVGDAFKDQIALLDLFDKRVSKPKRVIAIGASLGGIITAGLIQLYPDRFAGALPLCGVLAGGVANWNTGLDAAYAFKTLIAPSSKLQLVHIANRRRIWP
jgi:predicted peptidase